LVTGAAVVVAAGCAGDAKANPRQRRTKPIGRKRDCPAKLE